MKIFLPILFVAVIFCGCTKHDIVPPSIVGQWELRDVINGSTGGDDAYTAGNGNLYQFNSDKTYSKFKNDTVLVTKGTYTVNPGGTTINRVIYNTITFDGNTAASQVIQVANGNTLTLGLTINGGTMYLYAKVP